MLFGIACLIAEVFIPYHRYAGYLKLLTLVLLFYVAAAFSVHIPWGEVVARDVVADIALDRDMLLMVVAVFGTTISPYLFFWQASQEAEESRLSHRHMYAGDRAPKTNSIQAHLDRYLDRHGVFQSDRLFHHRDHGGDAALRTASPRSIPRRRPPRRCGRSAGR